MNNADNQPGAAREATILEAPEGTPLRVKRITGGCQAQSRLASMGIVPGEIITVIHKNGRGPLLLNVKGTRVALGHGISLKVTVEV